MSLKKWIEGFLKNKTERYQTQNLGPTPEDITAIMSKVVVKKGDASFDNANFGVQNNIYVSFPEHSLPSQALTSSIADKLDSIKDLTYKCKFDNALAEYHDLLRDYSIMNAVDKSIHPDFYSTRKKEREKK